MSEGFPGRAEAWPVSSGASNNNSGLGGRSVTPSPAGADNKDSLGRPGQTRPDKHDKTGRGCKPLGVAIGAGPLALPARDPLAQARNRGHGSALQRRLRLFSCCLSVTVSHLAIYPSIYPHPPSPSRPPGHPRLLRQTMESAVCCPRDCSTRVSRCNGQQKKTLLEVPACAVLVHMAAATGSV